MVKEFGILLVLGSCIISCLILSSSVYMVQCAQEQSDEQGSDFLMEKYAQKIEEYLNQHRKVEENMKRLQRWIQQRSLQGEEKGQQDLIVEELQKLQFDVVDVWEVQNVTQIKKENPLFHTPRDSLLGSPIVVGVWKGQDSLQDQNEHHISVDALTASQHKKNVKERRGRSLILNGHVDVVPEGKLSTWERDPFSGYYDKEKDRIYGRGSTDMKGGNYASLIAIEVLKKGLGLKLYGDVLFESVIEEESGGAGTVATILRGYKADAALIPEPTQMKIFPKQQGSMWFRIFIPGVAAHAGTRYEGISAIEKSYIVVQLLQKLERRRNDRVLELDELYRNAFGNSSHRIPIPINIGRIEGGKWPSSVPDEVIIEGRVGIIPGVENKEDTQKEIAHALEQELPEMDPFFKHHPVKLIWFGGSWLPGNIELDHPFYRILTQSYKTMLKQEPIVEPSPWGTDGGYLTHYGVPSIVFGPGDTALAHQSDESISVEKIYQCAKVIALSIVQWCGVVEP